MQILRLILLFLLPLPETKMLLVILDKLENKIYGEALILKQQ